MTKADIVNEIAKNTGVEKVAVQKTVEAFMETIKASLVNGESVFLRGFGSFVTRKRAEKTARNITKGIAITIVLQARKGLHERGQGQQEYQEITDCLTFKNTFICQAVRRGSATRWLRTSVRRD